MRNPRKFARQDRAGDKSQQPRNVPQRRHLKHGGRKPGTPNKTTQLLSDLVIEAAELVGSDLEGKDGLVGYLMRVGQQDTKAFSSLLRAVLPLKVKLEPDKNTWTLEDYRVDYERRGMEMPFWFPADFNGTLEELAEQLEKELSLEVKLLPKD
jgi:hypothetical protein